MAATQKTNFLTLVSYSIERISSSKMSSPKVNQLNLQYQKGVCYLGFSTILHFYGWQSFNDQCTSMLPRKFPGFAVSVYTSVLSFMQKISSAVTIMPRYGDF